MIGFWTGPLKRRAGLMAAMATFAVIGIVLLVSAFPWRTRAQSNADEAELAALLPQLKSRPVHTVDVTFDPSHLTTYVSALLNVGKQAGLSATWAQTSPDPNDIEVELWGRGILVTSIYRLENSPRNYSIFINAKDDRSAMAAADIILTKMKQGLASVPGLNLLVEK